MASAATAAAAMSLLAFCSFFVSAAASSSSADLSRLFYTASTTDHVQYVDDGREIRLALDQKNASGFQSYDAFLFGYFNMRIKLVPGDSAGTVTTYYFSSIGDDHDELDFEFLGNSSGEPLILQTNVFSSGHGEREQRIMLWFDPTADFHNYTILWNLYHVVFFVDAVPIRVFPNIEARTGLPYLRSRSMDVYATIWDGDSWATQGGRVKINWTHAPFVASYRDFSADACSRSDLSSSSSSSSSPPPASVYSDCASSRWWNGEAYRALDEAQISRLKWVQTSMTVYDYCTDYGRFNVTPPECAYQFASVPAQSPSPSPSPSPSSEFSSSSSPSPSPPTSSSSPSPSPSDLPDMASENGANPVPSGSLQGSNSHRLPISFRAMMTMILHALLLLLLSPSLIL